MIPGFRLELAEGLVHTCPDEHDSGPDFGAHVFACHHSKPGEEILCRGWLAAVGMAHPSVRLMVMRDQLALETLKPDPSWAPLHRSFAELIAARRCTCTTWCAGQEHLTAGRTCRDLTTGAP